MPDDALTEVDKFDSGEFSYLFAGKLQAFDKEEGGVLPARGSLLDISNQYGLCALAFDRRLVVAKTETLCEQAVADNASLDASMPSVRTASLDSAIHSVHMSPFLPQAAMIHALLAVTLDRHVVFFDLSTAFGSAKMTPLYRTSQLPASILAARWLCEATPSSRAVPGFVVLLDNSTLCLCDAAGGKTTVLPSDFPSQPLAFDASPQRSLFLGTSGGQLLSMTTHGKVTGEYPIGDDLGLEGAIRCLSLSDLDPEAIMVALQSDDDISFYLFQLSPNANNGITCLKFNDVYFEDYEKPFAQFARAVMPWNLTVVAHSNSSSLETIRKPPGDAWCHEDPSSRPELGADAYPLGLAIDLCNTHLPGKAAASSSQSRRQIPRVLVLDSTGLLTAFFLVPTDQNRYKNPCCIPGELPSPLSPPSAPASSVPPKASSSSAASSTAVTNNRAPKSGFDDKSDTGFGGFDDKADAGFGGFDDKADAGFGGFDDKSDDGFGGFDDKADAGFGGFDDKADAGFGDKGDAGFGGFDDKADAGFGGFDDKADAGFGGFDDKADAGFGGFDDKSDDSFGGFDDKTNAGSGGKTNAGSGKTKAGSGGKTNAGSDKAKGDAGFRGFNDEPNGDDRSGHFDVPKADVGLLRPRPVAAAASLPAQTAPKTMGKTHEHVAQLSLSKAEILPIGELLCQLSAEFLGHYNEHIGELKSQQSELRTDVDRIAERRRPDMKERLHGLMKRREELARGCSENSEQLQKALAKFPRVAEQLGHGHHLLATHKDPKFRHLMKARKLDAEQVNQRREMLKKKKDLDVMIDTVRNHLYTSLRKDTAGPSTRSTRNFRLAEPAPTVSSVFATMKDLFLVATELKTRLGHIATDIEQLEISAARPPVLQVDDADEDSAESRVSASVSLKQLLSSKLSANKSAAPSVIQLPNSAGSPFGGGFRPIVELPPDATPPSARDVLSVNVSSPSPSSGAAPRSQAAQSRPAFSAHSSKPLPDSSSKWDREEMTESITRAPVVAPPVQPVQQQQSSTSPASKSVRFTASVDEKTKNKLRQMMKTGYPRLEADEEPDDQAKTTGGGEWKCLSCEESNPDSSPECGMCMNPKPSSADIARAQSLAGSEPAADGGDFGFGFGDAGSSGASSGGGGEWKCLSCEESNPDSSPECGVCMNPKPSSADIARAQTLAGPEPAADGGGDFEFGFGGDGGDTGGFAVAGNADFGFGDKSDADGFGFDDKSNGDFGFGDEPDAGGFKPVDKASTSGDKVGASGIKAGDKVGIKAGDKVGASGIKAGDKTGIKAGDKADAGGFKAGDKLDVDNFSIGDAGDFGFGESADLGFGDGEADFGQKTEPVAAKTPAKPTARVGVSVDVKKSQASRDLSQQLRVIAPSQGVDLGDLSIGAAPAVTTSVSKEQKKTSGTNIFDVPAVSSLKTSASRSSSAFAAPKTQPVPALGGSDQSTDSDNDFGGEDSSSGGEESDGDGFGDEGGFGKSDGGFGKSDGSDDEGGFGKDGFGSGNDSGNDEGFGGFGGGQDDGDAFDSRPAFGSGGGSHGKSGFGEDADLRSESFGGGAGGNSWLDGDGDGGFDGGNESFGGGGFDKGGDSGFGDDGGGFGGGFSKGGDGDFGDDDGFGRGNESFGGGGFDKGGDGGFGDDGGGFGGGNASFGGGFSDNDGGDYGGGDWGGNDADFMTARK